MGTFLLTCYLIISVVFFNTLLVSNKKEFVLDPVSHFYQSEADLLNDFPGQLNTCIDIPEAGLHVLMYKRRVCHCSG